MLIRSGLFLMDPDLVLPAWKWPATVHLENAGKRSLSQIAKLKKKTTFTRISRTIFRFLKNALTGALNAFKKIIIAGCLLHLSSKPHLLSSFHL